MSDPTLESSIKELERLEQGMQSAYPADEAWSELVRGGSYEAALIDIEPKLEADPENAECKIWWIRCHLEVGRLPITALTAPLDDIAPQLENRRELNALSCGTFLRAAVHLFRKGQSRLGVSMLDRTRTFLNGLDREACRQLLEVSRSVISHEREQAPMRRESKSYLAALESSLSDIDAKKKSLGAGPTALEPSLSEEKPRLERLDSKSILNGALDAHSGERKENQTQSNEILKEDGSRRRLPGVGLLLPTAAVGLLLLLFAASWMYVFSSPDLNTLPQRLAIAEASPLQFSPIVPDPESGRTTQASVNDSSLDEVDERLKKLALSADSPSSQERTAEAAPPNGEIDEGALDPSSARRLPANTDDELVSMSNLPAAENEIQRNNVPTLDPGRFSTTRVEDVGTSGRKTPAPETAPLASTEAENYDPPRLFRTITPTEVLAAPSLLAKSLARLEAETPVHVTRKMGHWLELRSTGGNVGYIYAQDANPGFTK